MTIKIAINGFGRIGRNILRAYYERQLNQHVTIKAINDLGNIQTNAHLLQYDSTHGKFPYAVTVADQATIAVGSDSITVIAEKDPTKLPWQQLGIDLVFECTGRFTIREQAAQHLAAGAKRVIISAPGQDVDATIVYGVNHTKLTAAQTIISNASCTTNCLATIAKPLHETVGIVHGFMNTIHAYTNDQHLLDLYHTDLYRARAAGCSIIPTKTGAAHAVGLVLPELSGKLDGFALRIPTQNVSIVDFTFTAGRATSVDEINHLMQQATIALPTTLAINHVPLVSIDFNHHPASAIFEPANTKVIDRLVKVLAWYDNEWGFSNRMLDVAMAWQLS